MRAKLELRHFGMAMLIVSFISCASGSGGSRSDDEMDVAYRLAKRGYWQEALAHYERALALNPENPQILNNVAVSLEAVGRYDEARETYEKARRSAGADRRLARNYEEFLEFHETYLKPLIEKSKGREGPAEESVEQSDE